MQAMNWAPYFHSTDGAVCGATQMGNASKVQLHITLAECVLACVSNAKV